jgi:POT family proton-dependent oligopeptide transporter
MATGPTQPPAPAEPAPTTPPAPAAASPATPPGPARMPRQIPFIIANEGCERFSFYGMRNILVTFLITSVMMAHLPDRDAREGAAKMVLHTFMMGVYFFPLLGGWLADRFFGKYRTTLWLSLVYCGGHALLAVSETSKVGFYTGLLLIAIGSGGIKPLVASFVGDQFDQTNKHLAKVVFDGFYWIINFGSFFASLIMPTLLRESGPAWAFGIPGILMLLATIALWSGRKRYVMVPPQPSDPDSFSRVVWSALTTPAPGRWNAGLALALVSVALAIPLVVAAIGSLVLGESNWLIPYAPVVKFVLAIVLVLTGVCIGTWLQLDRARSRHSAAAVDGVRAVLRVLVVFALVTPFWSLFDQKASTWVIQAGAMSKPSWFSPAQMQALNPALVMLLIPFNNLVLYPALARRDIVLSPLTKMTIGMSLAGVAYVIVGIMQVTMDEGTVLPVTWQILPYVFLTMGEVLVSATGLEFAYSQAPLAMKGVIMSFWNLCTTVGNLWVLMADETIKRKSLTGVIADTGLTSVAFLMFFFAAFAFASALGFRVYARRYRMLDNYRTA